MSADEVFLVIISGLGVIHGLFLSTFLWTTKKGKILANRLLGTLLIVLSFRIGKSVFLEFLDNLDAKFIFIGLATLMAIGPLFYLYSKATIDKSFRWTRKQIGHFIPCFFGIGFGFWIEDDRLQTLPKLLFLVLFIGYYTHYIVYLIKARRYVEIQRKAGLSERTYQLLLLLFYGLLIIWVAYVLNLFDELVPYILGPVLYSIVAYIISFIIISKGYLFEQIQEKYKTTRISTEQRDQLYEKINYLIVAQRRFKNSDLSLKTLSSELHVSTQVLSMVINQKSEQNFNVFVNQHRIEEAMKMFNDEKNENLTISAIAFEVGFNSISSFNSAFKKYTGQTPQAFRKR